MAHGEKVTITYTVDVNESALEPNGRVKGDDGKNNIIVEDDEGDEDETTNIVHEIKFSDLDKLTTSQTETADGKIRMSWLITANTQRRASLVGSTVSDRIDPSSKDIMKYVKADGKVQLHVTGTDGEGNTYSRIIEVTPGDDQGQESWIWTVENIGEPQGTPLSYSIAYDTIAEKQTDNTAVKNDAENSSGGSDTGVGAVPGTDPGSGDTPPSIVTEKAATAVTTEYIDWDIVINVPICRHRIYAYSCLSDECREMGDHDQRPAQEGCRRKPLPVLHHRGFLLSGGSICRIRRSGWQ